MVAFKEMINNSEDKIITTTIKVAFKEIIMKVLF